jgi:DNA-directed RNA polymerase subunit RPC12/RpoP
MIELECAECGGEFAIKQIKRCWCPHCGIYLRVTEVKSNNEND